MFQSHEKKLILIALGILIFFFLISLLIIYPQYRSIQKMNQKILELRTSLEAKYEKTRFLHKSQNNLALAKQMAAELKTIFVKKGEEINFISYLENLADKFGVNQKIDITRPNETASAKVNQIDLQINAAGELANLLAYLNALERGDYLISISEVNISRGVSSLLNMSLKAEAYVQN